MKWNRETDYHGSRSYGADAPAVTRAGLLVAWLAAILRQKLRLLTGRPSCEVLVHEGERTFSVLGTEVRLPGNDNPFAIEHPSRLRHED